MSTQPSQLQRIVSPFDFDRHAKREQLQREALTRAQSGRSLMNYGPIFEGFIDKGIPEADILPRENVFTFNAWKAKGRSVKKGEHGVKVVTWIERTREGADGLPEVKRYCTSTTVFHISQTEVR
jgi:hypothetical protein